MESGDQRCRYCGTGDGCGMWIVGSWDGKDEKCMERKDRGEKWMERKDRGEKWMERKQVKGWQHALRIYSRLIMFCHPDYIQAIA